ncbi:unnamed protein product [Brassica rapa]|uniref:Uncharacterized protein n=1 Tax=Brassica campestris TaxID=3711 RepID=A0A3P6C346_BRACM|nr:unnamed protein product [Brassica rapa]VDD02922.1 unnamed protein product [Brassica rapa]
MELWTSFYEAIRSLDPDRPLLIYEKDVLLIFPFLSSHHHFKHSDSSIALHHTCRVRRRIVYGDMKTEYMLLILEWLELNLIIQRIDLPKDMTRETGTL